VPDGTGVAVYLPSNQDPTKPDENLINPLSKEPIRKALNLRGAIREYKVFVKFLEGVPQGTVDTYVPLSFALLSSVFEPIAEVHLELPRDNLVEELLKRVSARDDVPPGTVLRVLLIHRSQIVCVIPPTHPVVDLFGTDFRVEFVPDDQFDLSDGTLVKCAFAYNPNYPPNSTFLTPFFIKVENDEPFELTKGKIMSLISGPFGECLYIIYLGPGSRIRFAYMQDHFLLAELARSPDAQLFIVVRPEALQALLRPRDGSVRLYN
jgi:hypothetical protein